MEKPGLPEEACLALASRHMDRLEKEREGKK